MKRAIKIQEELEDELYLKDIGYVTFVEVEPGGTNNGLGYGPCGYDVVNLGTDGKVIAYRYSDDGIDCDWAIGNIDDVASAVYSMQVERINNELTDEMIDIWHAGTANGEFNELIERFGVFEILGSRTGNEPLTITAGE